MEYTEEEQDKALKTLSNLVKENQELRHKLVRAQLFLLRIFLSGDINFTDSEFSFRDNGIIQYNEDFETLIDYFFLDININHGNLDDDLVKNTFSVRIKDSTPFPKQGTRIEVLERLLDLEKGLFPNQ